MDRCEAASFQVCGCGVLKAGHKALALCPAGVCGQELQNHLEMVQLIVQKALPQRVGIGRTASRADDPGLSMQIARQPLGLSGEI